MGFWRWRIWRFLRRSCCWTSKKSFWWITAWEYAWSSQRVSAEFGWDLGAWENALRCYGLGNRRKEYKSRVLEFMAGALTIPGIVHDYQKGFSNVVSRNWLFTFHQMDFW